MGRESYRYGKGRIDIEDMADERESEHESKEPKIRNRRDLQTSLPDQKIIDLFELDKKRESLRKQGRRIKQLKKRRNIQPDLKERENE